MGRTLKWAGVFVASCAVLLGGLVWYINLDKTKSFFDAAGSLGRVETVSIHDTNLSQIHLLKIYNNRGEFLVECWYRRPKNLDPNYKVLLLYTGVKTKETILNLIPDQSNMVICAIQYPYQRPRKILEYVRWPWTVREAAYRVVGGGMLATTFLIDREKLDAARVTAVGASLGSFFGGIHGALDTRIPRVLIVHGGGNFHAMASAYPRLRDRGWPVWLCAEIFDKGFGTFDPLRYIDRVAPRELVILAASNDRYFPPESAQSLYDRAKEPKKIFWMTTSHVRAKKSETLDAILSSLKTHLFADTPPLK